MRCPSKADIIWCSLNPIKGHEQAGDRPCVVISGTLFNRKTGLAVILPITSTDKKDYFFRVQIDNKKTKGFVMIDQVRTIDWRKRKIRITGFTTPVVLKEIYGKLSVLFDNI